MLDQSDQYGRILKTVGNVFAQRGWPDDNQALEAMADAVEGLLVAEGRSDAARRIAGLRSLMTASRASGTNGMSWDTLEAFLDQPLPIPTTRLPQEKG
ncbi:hypothetical protein OS965_02280 [Streptomyces sp. H27-G5]|uniref:hypothetical protein n=1 Tax=Streptomyces sp. H27-G5 TaxID=2996698 RepID=UPI002270322D|nr:hypothetical protein [Streptomyces sp. H27-G5]MCY0917003.1 hypothetical protein [Streptomyces sp. H27-G5]